MVYAICLYFVGFSSIRSYSYSFPHTKNIVVIRARELNEYSYDRPSFESASNNSKARNFMF